MDVGSGDTGSSRGSSLGGSATSLLMARRSSAGGGTLSDINVTPFVDVVLVLLVIFMITAPLLTQGVKIELPKASAEPPPPRLSIPL